MNSRIRIETSSTLTGRRKERQTALFWLKHHLSRPSGGRKGKQPYSDWNIINLDPRVEGKASSPILLDTSSLSTLGGRGWRTGISTFPLFGRRSQQSNSDSNIINLDPRSKAKANSRFLIETSSITTVRRREKWTADFWFKHNQSRPSGEGKGEQSKSDWNISNLEPRAEGNANSRILIKITSISTLGRREWRTAVFWSIHHQSQPSCRGKGKTAIRAFLPADDGRFERNSAFVHHMDRWRCTYLYHLVYVCGLQEGSHYITSSSFPTSFSLIQLGFSCLFLPSDRPQDNIWTYVTSRYRGSPIGRIEHKNQLRSCLIRGGRSFASGNTKMLYSRQICWLNTFPTRHGIRGVSVWPLKSRNILLMCIHYARAYWVS